MKLNEVAGDGGTSSAALSQGLAVIVTGTNRSNFGIQLYRILDVLYIVTEAVPAGGASFNFYIKRGGKNVKNELRPSRRK